MFYVHRNATSKTTTDTHQLDFPKRPSTDDLNFFKVFRLHLKVSSLFNNLLICEESEGKKKMKVAAAVQQSITSSFFNKLLTSV